MEIWNSGSAIFGDCDNDAAYWDEILGQGKVWYGVATDDAHSYKELCKGWVMVKAEKDLNSILSALKNGEFYSSQGPLIYSLIKNGNEVTVECSKAKRISLSTKGRRTEAKQGENLTKATFKLKETDGYFRITVVDEYNNHAHTQAYEI